ncbi:arylsulfatase [Fulvivirga sp. M361]|uniref:arylsulfatase n=1 Tax=Fulvivirga sp. M361 TaxID=2594266 RepID=UPI00117AD34A|nr:arylsulfatase [Fulvivirga sp. M361]TRX48792.1 arylsulfatase [Fulvivirga sp. M361]
MQRVYYILVISFLSTQCSSRQETDHTTPPNIILILTDDQGWGDVGFHDNDMINTPHLDQLAKESVAFTRFYVSPVCAPTRASLLTGRYHLSTGVSWVTHRKEVLRNSEITIAELLQANGYRTGLFGKWHNGKQYPHDPNGQGFDQFIGFKEGHLNNYFDVELAHNQHTVTTKGYVPDVLTDAAIRFIQKDLPFFCYLSFNTPHSPFQVPDKYFKPYKKMGLNDKTSAVYGMITNIDDNIGRLLDALKRSGKETETIVIFLSDNGPNGHRYNGNLKGIKSHVDEGGVRVPFLVRYPGMQWNTDNGISAMAAHIDILPTLAELTGISIPDSLEIHGKSLVNTLQGQSPDTSRYFFTHQVRRTFDTIPGAVRTNRYLLTLQPEDTALYDLQNDPYQRQDISDAMPQMVSDLEKRYSNWFTDITKKGIEPQHIEIGHTNVAFIEFPAQEAISHENVQFKGLEGWANDYLVEWLDRSNASWHLRSLAESQYEVVLQASCDVGTAIQIKVGGQELNHIVRTPRIKKRLESPDRIKRGEVYEYVWPEIPLGTIAIAEGLHSLKVTSYEPKDLEVKSIILKLIKHDK